MEAFLIKKLPAIMKTKRYFIFISLLMLLLLLAKRFSYQHYKVKAAPGEIVAEYQQERLLNR